MRRRDVAALAKRLVQAVPLPLNPSDSPVEAFTRDDGSFELDHIPAGRARLTLMAGPVGRYSIALHHDLHVIEGANTHAELVSRDIVVFGRVTRAGMSMPRLRLLFEPRDLRFEEPDSSTRPGPPMSDEADAIPSSELEPMTAVTDERGDYQLLVTVPGKICLYVDAPQARFRYEPRVVEIPESADTHRLDLDLGGAMLSGTVVDDQGGPVPRALVSAIRVDKEPAVSTVETGPGGAFDLDLGPGKYVITGRAQGYAAWRGDGEVHLERGLSAEVSIALSRGLVAPGRVLDDKDHGVGNVHVYARATHVDPNPNRLSLGDGTSQMDGTFRILGLRDVPHILSARSDAGAFVIEPDVIPRSRGLKLTLRPGGRLLLRAVVRDLVPVEGAQAKVMVVDGTPVVFAPLLVGTDARGMLEMAIPAGIVTIRVWKVGLLREFTVQMARGGTETALVKMQAPP